MAPTGLPRRERGQRRRGGFSRAAPRLLALVAGLLLAGVVAGCGDAGGGSAASVPTVTAESQIALATVTPLATPAATPRPTATLAPTAPTRPTATPIPPTPAPKPAPVPPTPTPAPSPPPATFAIAFTCAAAVDHAYGEVCIQTQPGTQAQIAVQYCSGRPATSPSLQGTRVADGGGNITWTWTPNTRCHGPATARVTALWNGRTATASQTFTVY